MDSSSSPFQFPPPEQDDYALAMLTHAAMRTSSEPGGSSHGHGHGQHDRAQGEHAEINQNNSSSSTTGITNRHHQQHHHHQPHHPQQNLDHHRNGNNNNHQHPHPGNALGVNIPSADYNPAELTTSNAMEALAFTAALPPRQNPYMNHVFQGAASQMSSNYANGLAILDAESYDDGRAAAREREASQARLKSQSEAPMPFGITGGPRLGNDHAVRSEVEGSQGGSRKRKKPRVEHQSVEDEDEPPGEATGDDSRKKARGRPRVAPKDETPADRRRTQIRMAQRAYRNRKETTISSLEKQVQDLKGMNEQMSNIFINLHDFAMANGVLQREPEFGHQLQSTTQKFLALAKMTSEDETMMDEEDHAEDHLKKSHAQGKTEGKAESTRQPRRSRPSPKASHEEVPPVSEPIQGWGGYSVSNDESPGEEVLTGYNQQNDESRNRHSDFQVISRPTEDNASFPFGMVDLEQYRVEVPPMEGFAHNFIPQFQPPLPTTYAFHEFSLARRIQRAALERAFKLISLPTPPAKRLYEVFGICMRYESKDIIKDRLRKLLARGTKETLQEWRAPFAHIGGAGTFYPMAEIDFTAALMPKFRTGLSMGPFPPTISEVQETMQPDLRCTVPGFEGDFFDPNDVEGYLRRRGVEIPPAADFVNIELDLLVLSEVPSPHSSCNDSDQTMVSPLTPRSPVRNTLISLDPDNSFYSFNSNQAEENGTTMDILEGTSMGLHFPVGSSNWSEETFHKRSKDTLGLSSSLFNAIPDQNPRAGTPGAISSSSRHSEKRTVVLNVSILIEEIIGKAVCLGRASGFKPADVEKALMAALRAGF